MSQPDGPQASPDPASRPAWGGAGPLGQLAGRWTVASWRHPKRALAAVLLATLILGAGVPLVETAVDPVDALPEGDPHTRAARNVTTSFRSTFTQQASLIVSVDPQACLEDSREDLPARHGPDGSPGPTVRCGNITDEVYLRALDELFTFVQRYGQEHPPVEGQDEVPLRFMVALPSFYKLYNWTMAGGQDQAPQGAFALPGPQDRARTTMVLESGWRVMDEALTSTLDSDHEDAAVFLLPDPKSPYTGEQIGRFTLDALQAYDAWAQENATYQVFTGDNAPRVAVNTPIARAHGATLVQEDLTRILPVLFALATAVVALAYRDLRVVGVAWLTGGITLVWTGGLMGYLGLPLGPLTLAAAPVGLVLGLVAAVRWASDVLGHVEDGVDPGWAAGLAGAQVGGAFTVAGGAALLTGLAYAASPSPLYAEATLAVALAAAIPAVLVITLVPASLCLLGLPEARPGPPFRPRFFPGLRRSLAEHRALLIIGLVLLGGTALAATQTLEPEPLASPPRNLPEDDPLRRQHEAALAAFYNVPEGTAVPRTDLVVIQGEITTPEAHTYLDALKASLVEQAAGDETLHMGNSRNLPDIIRLWLLVRDGPASVTTTLAQDRLPGPAGQQTDQYPETQAEIEATIDEMFTSPMATFASLSVDHPADRITVIPTPLRVTDTQEADHAWQLLTAATEGVEGQRPAGVHVAFVGKAPANHQVIQAQLPWLWAIPLVGLPALTGLAYLHTRDHRTAGLACVPPILSGLGGLALLILLGRGFSPDLAIPGLLAVISGGPVTYWVVARRGPPSPGVPAWRWTGAVVANLLLAGSLALFVPIEAIGWPGVRELTLQGLMVVGSTVVGLGALAGLAAVSLLGPTETASSS